MSSDDQSPPGLPGTVGLEEGTAAPARSPAEHRPLERSSAYPRVDAIRAGLPGLDSTGRRAVELAYFRGLTVPTIASVLALPESEVRAAMRSAMLQLGSLVRDGQSRER